MQEIAEEIGVGGARGGSHASVRDAQELADAGT